MKAVVENFDLILHAMENGESDIFQPHRCATVRQQVKRLKAKKTNEVLE